MRILFTLAFAALAGAQGLIVDPAVYAGGMLRLRFAPTIAQAATIASWIVTPGPLAPACAAAGTVTQAGIYTAPAAVAAPCSVTVTARVNTDAEGQMFQQSIWVLPTPAAPTPAHGAIRETTAAADADSSSIPTGLTGACSYVLLFRNGLALESSAYALSADWATLTMDVAAGDVFKFVCFP